jgi:hypothetical protein
MANSEYLNLKFHSFCSVFTKASSNETASEFNVFKSDKYSSYSYEVTTTPDVTYDPDTGFINLLAQGNYFVICSMQMNGSSGNTTVVGKLKKNGDAFLTSDSVVVKSAEDPKQLTMHRIIRAEAGDVITATFNAGAADFGVVKGTHITVLKLNGAFANAAYSAGFGSALNTGTSTPIYDSDLGGTVVTELSSVNHGTATGKFTNTSESRTYLLFSTWIFDSGGDVGDFFHKIRFGDDSSATTIDELTAGTTTGDNPECHSFHSMKVIPANDYATVNFDQGGSEPFVDFVVEKGTSFSMIDVSSMGVLPSAMLSMTLDDDSTDFSTSAGEKNIWDTNNHSSFAKTDQITATNITFTQANGRFTVNEKGHYLVVSTIGISDADDGTPNFRLKINGSTHYDADFDIRADADPRGFAVCLIVPLEAGDYLELAVNNPGGKFDDGCSVSIVKVDDVGTLYPRTNTTEELIDLETNVINNYSFDSLSQQHDRVNAEQVPFILGSRTPIRLRGHRNDPKLEGDLKYPDLAWAGDKSSPAIVPTKKKS